jgi:hypothetical protein
MEDWALIRRLAADGVPKAKIARDLGISRTTVVKAVALTVPPKYERTPMATSFTPFEARVRQLLVETPDMPATVLAERAGFTGCNPLLPRQRQPGCAPMSARSPGGPALDGRPARSSVRPCCFPPKKILLRVRHDDHVAGAGDHLRPGQGSCSTTMIPTS